MDEGPEGTQTCSPDCHRRGVRQIAASGAHTCAILWEGEVKCWGVNASGQLGLGDRDVRGLDLEEMGANLPAVDLGPGRIAKDIAVGSAHTCAILDDDSLKCWGDNEFGPLGLGDTEDRGDEPGEMGLNLPTVDLGPGRTARTVVTGQNYTCALLDDNSVKCWGRSWYLGLGDFSDHRGDKPNEMGANLEAVALGPAHTLALQYTIPASSSRGAP